MTRILGDNHLNLTKDERWPRLRRAKFGKKGRKGNAERKMTSLPLELADAARNASSFSFNSQKGNDLRRCAHCLKQAEKRKTAFFSEATGCRGILRRLRKSHPLGLVDRRGRCSLGVYGASPLLGDVRLLRI